MSKIASLVTYNAKAEANEASCGQSLSPKVTQSQVSEHARMRAAQVYGRRAKRKAGSRGWFSL